jgi:hypothetical protein
MELVQNIWARYGFRGNPFDTSALSASAGALLPISQAIVGREVDSPESKIQRERMICKFWIQPVVLARNQGFAPKELNTIREIILKNSHTIMEAWYEHCGKNTRNEN